MNDCIIETNTSGEESMLAFFKESWPPLFCGKELDKLTGKTLQWRTIQNRRARREIPENCFTKVGSRKVIVLRDPFLAWLATDIARHNASSTICSI